MKTGRILQSSRNTYTNQVKQCCRLFDFQVELNDNYGEGLLRQIDQDVRDENAALFDECVEAHTRTHAHVCAHSRTWYASRSFSAGLKEVRSADLLFEGQ